jgi:hypothetical protein
MDTFYIVDRVRDDPLRGACNIQNPANIREALRIAGAEEIQYLVNTTTDAQQQEHAWDN